MGRFQDDFDIIKFESQWCNHCMLQRRCNLIVLHAKYPDNPALDEIIRFNGTENACRLHLSATRDAELKPCPLCGKIPAFKVIRDLFVVECFCGLSFAHRNFDFLIETWNGRAHDT